MQLRKIFKRAGSKRYHRDGNSSKETPTNNKQNKKNEEDDGDLPQELLDAIDNDKGKDSDTLIDNGILYLRGEINQRSITPVIEGILARDMTGYQGELWLFINSPGGDAEEMWTLIDLMHSTRIPITTVGMGMIASAAAMILSAGDPGRRFTMPRTEIMVHPFSWGVAGTIHEMKAALRGAEREWERFVKFWLTHSKYKSRRELEKHLLKPLDNYMTAREALKHGIIDGIIDDQRHNKLLAFKKQTKTAKKKKKRKKS